MQHHNSFSNDQDTYSLIPQNILLSSSPRHSPPTPNRCVAPMHPTSGQSFPPACNGIADSYYREQSDMNNSQEDSPTLRTDDLTDRDLYTNPALSSTKEYWSYTPPRRSHLEELIHRTPSSPMNGNPSSSSSSKLKSRSGDPEDISDIVYQVRTSLFIVFLIMTYYNHSFF
jgi:hypothetical protein